MLHGIYLKLCCVHAVYELGHSMHTDCILPLDLYLLTAVLESKYLFHIENIVSAMFFVYLTK